MYEFIDWESEIKKETIAKLYKLEVDSKTITLLMGQSMAGKTATCLHFVNDAIKKEKYVYYYDTDEKPIMNRPDPNLFRIFLKENEKKYKKYFKYSTSFDFDLCKHIDGSKCDLIVIDSIYTPFYSKYPNHANKRASEIRKFISQLRDLIWKKGIGVIITTKIGRIVKNKKEEMVALGGEGLKYASDVKVFINFNDSKDKDNEVGDKRFFVVDRQKRYAFNIQEGGIIKEIK